MIDDRDFSWMGKPAPPPAAPVEYPLWTLTKRTHRVDCGVRATPLGPEIRVSLNGELWWSHVYRGATTAETDRKSDEFVEKGWAP